MPLSRIQKIGAGTAAAAVSATALLGGTYAAFTNTQATPAQAIAAGTVSIGLTGSASTTTPLSDMAAGDTVFRYVDITNSGTLSLLDVKLTTSITTPNGSVLFSDANGVTLKVDACSGTWTVSTGVCSVAETAVLAATKLSTGFTAAALTPAPLAKAAVTKYKLTYFIPLAADGAIQGDTGDVTLTFKATQRAETTTGA